MRGLIRVSNSVVALVLIALVFYLGIRSERTGFVREVLDPGLKRISRPVLNAFRGRPPEVPQLLIALDPEERDSLDALQRSALEAGWVGSDLLAHFAVTATYNEVEVPAVIGLKEGPAREEASWTYQVRLLPGDTVLGMRTFDLEPVLGPQALHAAVLPVFWEQLGLPMPGAALVELTLGEGFEGLFIAREGMDGLWCAQQGLGSGPILRLDDGLTIQAELDIADVPEPRPALSPPDWSAAPIMVVDPGRLSTDAAFAKRTAGAVKALEDLRAGRRPASEVFEVASTAKAMAMADLIGAQDALQWTTVRMVLDSLSGRLKLTPTTGRALEPTPALLATRRDPAVPGASTFTDRLLEDPVMLQAYVACLDSLSNETAVLDLWTSVEAATGRLERIVMAEYTSAKADRSTLDRNRVLIQRSLFPREAVLAYVRPARSTTYSIAVANVHSLPVQVLALVAGKDTIPVERPLLLPPREPGRPLRYVRVEFAAERTDQRTLHVLVTIPGLQGSRTAEVRMWSVLDAE
ncbi:MAG TPA: hypothetical protein PLN54_09170 [Flavobacteriales bacterium]|nr:hypothetical protein [Flavobacteriales bacterium]